MTIGTQDDEMLAKRAQSNDYLPSQWEYFFTSVNGKSYRHDRSAFWNHPRHDQLRSSDMAGIACPLPPLEAGQAFQIPFAIAWDRTDSPSPAATSIAVEVSPAQILAGGGCS